MGRFLKNRSAQRGLPPGSLVHIGKDSGEVEISVMDYSEESLNKEEIITKDEIHKFAKAKNPTWININGLGDTEVIQNVGDIFDIHPLTLEDILNTGQRPKFEEFEKYLYVVLKMLTFNDKTKTIESEQVSVLMTKTCLISFQERKGDVFDNVRERIRHGKGRIRKMGTDYLGYSLIDSLIDNYFVVLEQIGENVEPLDDNVIKNPEFSILEKIHHYKQELLYLRKVVWPLRDLSSGINRSETALISKQVNYLLPGSL
jgi:magnesium transporter